MTNAVALSNTESAIIDAFGVAMAKTHEAEAKFRKAAESAAMTFCRSIAKLEPIASTPEEAMAAYERMRPSLAAKLHDLGYAENTIKTRLAPSQGWQSVILGSLMGKLAVTGSGKNACIVLGRGDTAVTKAGPSGFAGYLPRPDGTFSRTADARPAGTSTSTTPLVAESDKVRVNLVSAAGNDVAKRQEVSKGAALALVQMPKQGKGGGITDADREYADFIRTISSWTDPAKRKALMDFAASLEASTKPARRRKAA